jgi:hypothetical protein
VDATLITLAAVTDHVRAGKLRALAVTTDYRSSALPDVPSIRGYVPAVVRRISEDLLLADLALHEERTRADVPPDFDESFYVGAIWQAGAQQLAA